jgi:hypothetical protein
VTLGAAVDDVTGVEDAFRVCDEADVAPLVVELEVEPEEVEAELEVEAVEWPE